MKDKHTDSHLNKIGLFKVFASMDTQSAIVAAIVISVITFAGAVLVDLCSYIYWNAYFTSFNIPLAYIDEAIIHENGIKYVAILYAPVLLFVWWLFGAIEKAIRGLWTKITKKFVKNPVRHDLGFKVLASLWALVLVLLFFAGVIFLIEWFARGEYWALLALYAEFLVYCLWSFCKATLGKRFSFSGRSYYLIRAVGGFVLIYLLLGSVYFSGSMTHYDRNAAQSLQIVYDSNINYYTLNDSEQIESQLVLLETEDYYYVTDVTIRKAGGLYVQIHGNDSYRFIDKVDCPVKSVYAHLSYIGGRHNQPILNQLVGAYVIVTAVFSFVFISLLSIPMRKKAS